MQLKKENRVSVTIKNEKGETKSFSVYETTIKEVVSVFKQAIEDHSQAVTSHI